MKFVSSLPPRILDHGMHVRRERRMARPTGAHPGTVSRQVMTLFMAIIIWEGPSCEDNMQDTKM